jgi:hypothetical protein
MPSERDRTRLIAELASLLRECQMPDDARCAGLTLIGWLARRMEGEAPSIDGVEHARSQLLTLHVSRTSRFVGQEIVGQEIVGQEIIGGQAIADDRDEPSNGCPSSEVARPRPTTERSAVGRTKKHSAA